MTDRDGNAFVLLAGGGMGAWIWERLIPLLEYPALAVDRRYEAPDGTGKKERKASIADCAEYAAGLMERNGIRNAILVAHSGAGIIVPRIHEFTSCIRKTVFIAANIPPAGKSALDMLPFPIRMMNVAAILLRTKPTPMVRAEKIIRSRFCNATEEPWVKFILGHELRPEPLGVAFEKRTSAPVPELPSVYVKTLRDGTLSGEGQERMASNYDACKVVELDADHMVMLSAPEKLAGVLNAAAREVFVS